MDNCEVASLGLQARLVCVHTLLDTVDGQPCPAAVYMKTLLQTDRYTAVSEDILTIITESLPHRVDNDLLLALTPPHIKSVSLRNCGSITAMGMERLLTKCKRLERLDLGGVHHLMRPTFFQLCAYTSPHLTSLNLEANPRVSDECVWTVLLHLPSLLHLSLSLCENITDDAFYIYTTHHPNQHKAAGVADGRSLVLSSIDLQGCPKLTSTSIRYITRLCGASLRKINMSCTQVDCTSLLYLAGYSLPDSVDLSLCLEDPVDRLVCVDMRTDHGQDLSTNVDYIDTEQLTKLLNQADQQMHQADQQMHQADQQLHQADQQLHQADQQMHQADQQLHQADQQLHQADQQLHQADQQLHQAPAVSPSAVSASPVSPPTARPVSVDYVNYTLLGATSSLSLHSVPSSLSLHSVPWAETRSHHPTSNSSMLDPPPPPATPAPSTGPAVPTAAPAVPTAAPAVPTAAPAVPAAAASHMDDLYVEDLISISDENPYCLPSDVIVGGLTSHVDGCTSHVGGGCTGDKQYTHGDIADIKDTQYTHGDIADIKDTQYTHGDITTITDTQCNHDVIADIKDTHLNTKSEPPHTTCPHSVILPPEEEREEVIVNNERSESGDGPDVIVDNESSVSGDGPDVIVDNESSVSGDGPDVAVESDGVRSREVRLDEVTDRAPTFLHLYQPVIESIDMSFIQLHGKLLPHVCLQSFFTNNPLIRELSISWTRLEDAMLDSMADQCPRLASLSLTDCDLLTTSGLANVMRKCHNLRKLHLQGVSFIGDAAIVPVLKQVHSLNLAETYITDDLLTKLSQVSHQLRELDLSWCDEVTDVGLSAVASSCRQLRRLSLHQSCASCETVRQMAETCCHLEDVNLSCLPALTNSTVSLLAAQLTQLTKVDISWNMGVSDEGVTSLLRCCLHLRDAQLAGLKQLTAKPFLPIINNVKQWRRCQALLHLKYEECKMLDKLDEGQDEGQDSSDEEFEDLYLPSRSVVYAPRLSHVDLIYCDCINDSHIAEIVAVCRGTLTIQDYYGALVEPSFLTRKAGRVFLTRKT